jgi:hypothetical protein
MTTSDSQPISTETVIKPDVLPQGPGDGPPGPGAAPTVTFETRDLAGMVTLPRLPQAAPPPASKAKALIITGAIIVIFAMIGLIGIGAWYFNRVRQPAGSQTGAGGNSIQLWLNVQTARDRPSLRQPVKQAGLEIFGNGSRFQINAASLKKGYLYIFNEGTDRDRGKFWILFPTPARNGGVAVIDDNEDIQTGWNVFSGDPGTEKCWLIWTRDKNDTLEDARKGAIEDEAGEISPGDAERLGKFIAGVPPSAARRDVANKQLVIESGEGTIVSLLELEHR